MEEILSENDLLEYLNSDNLSEEELTTLAAQMFVLRNLKKVVEKNMDIIKKIFDKHLDHGSFIFGNYRVTKSVYTRKKLNTARLKEHLGDMYHLFEDEVKVIRISVERED